MQARSFVVSLLALTLAGCAVRPPYKAPVVDPATLKNADPSAFSTQSYDPRWWRQFDDPVLEALQASALASNHDVRIAVARVRQARAIFDDVERDRYPIVTAGAAVERRSQAVPGLSDEPQETSTYRAGFDAFW